MKKAIDFDVKWSVKCMKKEGMLDEGMLDAGCLIPLIFPKK
jgi:hypothetical protein